MAPMNVISDRLLRLVRDPNVSQAMSDLVDGDGEAITVQMRNGKRVTIRKCYAGERRGAAVGATAPASEAGSGCG